CPHTTSWFPFYQQFSCQCLYGWKGAFCTEIVSVCDPEHKPPHQCSADATCIPLPYGYACHCPLGKIGTYCEQAPEKQTKPTINQYRYCLLLYILAVSISDPSFRATESSWMAFTPFNIRHKTHISMQFKPLSADGILFYTAQHLNPRSGDFLSISLAHGFVQLRYNLGDRTVILQTNTQVDTSGRTWHLVKAGRSANKGYLELDGSNVTQKATAGMTALDTRTDFYVGGVSMLNAVSALAVEDEPTGFDGCIRELIVNDIELNLSETGAQEGVNIGDCDGTACGYKVCNMGNCISDSSDNFTCSCPPLWVGSKCELSMFCLVNLCQHSSLCVPDVSTASYTCACPLGWGGTYCENQIALFTLKFVGNSYVKYTDPYYKSRNLEFTRISLNFTTNENEGLILWIGKAENEDNDFLAIGVQSGNLKVAVNLGERISVPLIYREIILCCNKWHFVTVLQNQTNISVYLEDKIILFEDIDPERRYVALNYESTCYFGGFELSRKVKSVTSGVFTQGLVGKIKDVLFQDSRKVQFNGLEGYNVYSGDN
uniref:Crumbs cell polarity complex component 2 n=1 Tax=Latimeria chalumnae TaxID=7897 RepID=H2ZYW6_LATCH